MSYYDNIAQKSDIIIRHLVRLLKVYQVKEKRLTQQKKSVKILTNKGKAIHKAIPLR